MNSVALPPSPKSRPVVGHLLDYNHDPIGFLSNCVQNYGDVVLLQFGKRSFYLVNNPDTIEEILVTKSRQFGKSQAIRSHRILLGNGLLTSDGDFWQRQRRLAQPAFHRDRIAAYADAMVSHTNRLLTTWQEGDVRDIHQEMMQLTLAIVVKLLFNVEFVDEVEEVGDALAVAMQHFRNRLAALLVPAWMPTPGKRRFQKAVDRLDAIVYRIIQQHRSTGESGDLLSLLLQARDEADGSQMTDQQLRDEVMTIFLAGHETTANALTWGWMLLAQNPDVQETLAHELRTVLGGRAPTLQDLPQLQYTEKVVLETMRLYPPAWLIARQALQDCEVGNYHLPAGTVVMISQWLMHRDARFFTEPDRFQPDRWTSDLKQQLPAFAYFPFGGGSRICIGKSFAMMEAVLLLATIAQKFQLNLLPTSSTQVEPSLTLRPKFGLTMQLQRAK